MNQKKNVKVRIMSVLSKFAFHEATQSANSSCIFWAYQPKLPDAVKKLRKF